MRTFYYLVQTVTGTVGGISSCVDKVTNTVLEP